MTLGASTMAAAVAVARAPLAVTRNRRRSVVTLASSARRELMVGAFGHVIPWAHQRLELRERGVDLAGHRGLLRLLPNDVAGQPLEVAQHRERELDHLDLALELRLESLERDGVLGVVVRESVGLHRGRGVIECPLEIDRERLVRFPVEAEFVHGAGL